MERRRDSSPGSIPRMRRRRKRWISHEAHEAIPPPVRVRWTRAAEPWTSRRFFCFASIKKPIGQAGRPGRLARRGGRPDPPHCALALAPVRPALPDGQDPGQPRQARAAGPSTSRPSRPRPCSGNAEVSGVAVGSRELVFRPGAYSPRDLTIDIGTAGSTGLVLQTLHLPLAMRAESPVRVVLTGGTFNPKAPPFLFLEHTWRGLSVRLRPADQPGDDVGRLLPQGRRPARCLDRAGEARRVGPDRPRAACGESAAWPEWPISPTTSPGGSETGRSSGWRSTA